MEAGKVLLELGRREEAAALIKVGWRWAGRAGLELSALGL